MLGKNHLDRIRSLRDPAMIVERRNRAKHGVFAAQSRRCWSIWKDFRRYRAIGLNRKDLALRPQGTELESVEVLVKIRDAAGR